MGFPGCWLSAFSCPQAALGGRLALGPSARRFSGLPSESVCPGPEGAPASSSQAEAPGFRRATPGSRERRGGSSAAVPAGLGRRAGCRWPRKALLRSCLEPWQEHAGLVAAVPGCPLRRSGQGTAAPRLARPSGLRALEQCPPAAALLPARRPPVGLQLGSREQAAREAPWGLRRSPRSGQGAGAGSAAAPGQAEAVRCLCAPGRAAGGEGRRAGCLVERPGLRHVKRLGVTL